MMTIKEAAEMWGISTRRVLKLCSEGRISGAVKESKWLIPTDAKKPKDKRVNTGEFIKDNPSSVFSFLLVAGYLKVVKTEVAFVGDYMCELAIPNREISLVYNKEILERMSRMIPQGVAMDVHIALYSGNSEKQQAI
jgi:hypothetical protein